MTTDDHAARVAAELHDVGASSYGAIKFASRYLPTIIHADEHIMGAVYGRYKEDGGLLKLSAGMLIATDKRIIFLDHKPGFTSTDEVTYEVVSGVKKVSGAFASSVTLHTRVGDYVIRYANASGVDKFINYIEQRRLDVGEDTVQSAPAAVSQTQLATIMDNQTIEFLKDHEVGVLSTIDRTGGLHGAAIYYFLDNQNRICMATKTSTQKARDMFANQQIALTVYDAETIETVQLEGYTEVVAEPAARQSILNNIVKPRDYKGGAHLPPVTTIHEEGYVALYINPTNARYVNYRQRLEDEGQ